MRAALLLFPLLVMSVVPAGAADPLTHPSCGPAGVTAFASGQGVVENLLFDGAGSLFVTRDGALWRYGPDGAGSLYAGSIGGGLARGPDGALYAGTLNNAAQALARTGASGVARIDLDDGNVETHAAGFDMANGLAFDAGGNLYVSNDFQRAIVRIAPDRSWTMWATSVYSPNGMVVDDAAGVLYAALTFDQRSPIVAISLADPSQVAVVAELSLGALTLEPGLAIPGGLDAPLVVKGLDDMTRGSDGALYVAANAAGELLRVDPATGAACVVASGMPNASSVRFARGFGAWDGQAFVTAFDGHIWAISWAGA